MEQLTLAATDGVERVVKICVVPRCPRRRRYPSHPYCSRHSQQAAKGVIHLILACDICGSLPDERRAGRVTCSERCKQLRSNLRRYGLTFADYRAMHEAQGGRCAGCLEPYGLFSVDGRRRLHIDHCHLTGRVRGLLCAACNLAAGKMGDRPDVALRLAAYLARHAEDANGQQSEVGPKEPASG